MESEKKYSSKRWIKYPVFVLVVMLGIVIIVPLFLDRVSSGAFCYRMGQVTVYAFFSALVLGLLSDRKQRMKMDNPQAVQQPKTLSGGGIAKASVVLPIISVVLSVVLPQRPHQDGFVLGSVKTGLVVAGFALAVFVLCRIKKYGAKGVVGWAIAGVTLNSLIIVSFLTLSPVLTKVMSLTDIYGYTQKQMGVMPEVIPDSTKIINNEIGFRIEIPEGFEPVQPRKSVPEILYEYHMVQDDEIVIIISIQRLRSIMRQEELNDEFFEGIRETTPEGTEITTVKERWGDYTLDVIKLVMYIQGNEILTRAVQVPLAREAIQIVVTGAPQHEQQCVELLRDLLKSLKGKSNWST